MEHFPKNNVNLAQGKELAHGCACGSNCTCASNCTCGPADFKDADIWEYSLPRRVSAEFIEAEEKERQRRSLSGVSPLVYARLFRCQTELMHKHIPTSMLNDARSQALSIKGASLRLSSALSEKFSGVKSSLANMAHNLEVRSEPVIDDLYARSQIFAVATNIKAKDMQATSAQLAEDSNKKMGEMTSTLRESAEIVGDRASSSFEDMKAKLNIGVDPSSRIAEEKERARRQNEKIDPMVAARLGRVQGELVQSVKSI